MKTNTALVAMSGGVDSTVAALLAINEGVECQGVTMIIDGSMEKDTRDTNGRDTNGRDVSARDFNASDLSAIRKGSDIAVDAKRAAAQLGIELHVLDLSKDFAKDVIEYFIEEYRNGRTPNPCVRCNKRIKFKKLLEKADQLGVEYLLTGHYARIQQEDSGRYLLKKGLDEAKDQSYSLYTLGQEQLARLRFPLGEYTKSIVRELALDAGLDCANKSESQDICFIPDGDYGKFIEEYIGEHAIRGRFIDCDGRDLGEHRGIIHYTIGQRRGLGLAMTHPPYVVDICPEDNTIVVGRNELLYSKSLDAGEINLLAVDRLETAIDAKAKIRYNQREQPARIWQRDENTLHIEFVEAQRAITKGQSVVIYDGDVVIGGGIIM